LEGTAGGHLVYNKEMLLDEHVHLDELGLLSRSSLDSLFKNETTAHLLFGIQKPEKECSI